MKLRIQAADPGDHETLRALLIDAADDLAGAGSHVLEDKLPWDGHPILLADAAGHPVLVSFDIHNSLAALLNGLQASDRLVAALPWLNQVYKPLQQLEKPPRLIVVSAVPPPGHQALLTGNPALTLLTCRLLRVNDDTGVLLENLDLEPRLRAPSPHPASQPVPLTVAARPRDPAPAQELPPLSAQEIVYFQQL
jgi:hypothetical protein